MQSSLHEELAKSSTTYAAKEANAPLEECNDEVKRQLSSSTTEQRPTKKFKNGETHSTLLFCEYGATITAWKRAVIGWLHCSERSVIGLCLFLL